MEGRTDNQPDQCEQEYREDSNSNWLDTYLKETCRSALA